MMQLCSSCHMGGGIFEGIPSADGSIIPNDDPSHGTAGIFDRDFYSYGSDTITKAYYGHDTIVGAMELSSTIPASDWQATGTSNSVARPYSDGLNRMSRPTPLAALNKLPKENIGQLIALWTTGLAEIKENGYTLPMALYGYNIAKIWAFDHDADPETPPTTYLLVTRMATRQLSSVLWIVPVWQTVPPSLIPVTPVIRAPHHLTVSRMMTETMLMQEMTA